jgi:hypothetical protein
MFLSTILFSQVVIAVILIWLWAQHKESFQRAFAKSGRIDVDPECKWLIQTAVDAAARALMLDIADTIARGGSMTTALSGGPRGGDRHGSSSSVEVHVARVISQGLMGEFCIDDVVVSHRRTNPVCCYISVLQLIFASFL